MWAGGMAPEWEDTLVTRPVTTVSLWLAWLPAPHPHTTWWQL